MPTLGSLSAHHPSLELAFVWPRNSAPHQPTAVTGLITLPLTTLLEASVPHTLFAGALILVTGTMPFRVRGRIEAAMETLLQQMALEECAGLIVTAAPGVHQPFPQSIRDISDKVDIPLLVTTAPKECWAGVHAGIQRHRLAAAERRANRLSSLVQQLPAQLGDEQSMQRIADWLAQALDAQVLVSEQERVLAASPATAVEHLAHAIIHQSVEGNNAEGPSGPHTQLIPLAPASGGHCVLAVARKTPFDEADLRLLRHAAKLLGLVDQACREYQAADTAAAAARTAAVELLLDGEVGKARRVMASLAPGLLDPESVRVFVVETSNDRRDAVVRRCETATAGHALVIADPRQRSRILVIQPVQPDDADDIVAVELTRLVSALGARTSLGGSGIYSLTLLADALQEAVNAQRFAVHQPDSVALSVQDTCLVSLLAPREAQAWARTLLQPLMQPDAQWEHLRETLPTALAYPYIVAARRLDLHRNTVTRRVARAAELLDRDFATLKDRIAVSLALELVTHHDLPESDAGPLSGEAPTLQELLDAPHIRAWAESQLSTARTDKRALLDTATAWLTFDAHFEPTARALGLSEATVRSHIRALEGHLGRDLSSLNGMRDLLVALYLMTGEPGIPEASRELCAVA
ncbi:helix-turn-helix domain-containing protein [Streptomyces sp. AHU1]|uniref:helix-turn-helix domain-containing protein n=1 Tax=Streptomyces sp. AHU1 TaxID=3377215 RepID=UPI0038779107